MDDFTDLGVKNNGFIQPDKFFKCIIITLLCLPEKVNRRDAVKTEAGNQDADKKDELWLC